MCYGESADNFLLSFVSIDTLHKGDTEDNNNNVTEQSSHWEASSGFGSVKVIKAEDRLRVFFTPLLWQTWACFDDISLSILGVTVLTVRIKSVTRCGQFLCLVWINAMAEKVYVAQFRWSRWQQKPSLYFVQGKGSHCWLNTRIPQRTFFESGLKLVICRHI